MALDEPPLADAPGLLAFCRTFEAGSFTAAAARLGQTPAAVSRAVGRLERRLGARLFRRTTRRLRPTPEAEEFYARCVVALTSLREAERALGGDEVLRGTLRLSVPTTVGISHLLERMTGFGDRFPELRLDVQVANHSVDFVREGFDLAVRQGHIDDAGLVVRRLGDPELAVYASPGYLEAHGAPTSIADLASHRVIPFVMPRTGRVLPWSLRGPTAEWVPDGPIRCLDDPQALLALARADLGLVQTYRFVAARDLKLGAVREVLEDRGGATRRFSIVYPVTARTAAVRAVAAFLAERGLESRPRG
ncbi:MAG: LysR family transcriptional regulator [Myxococcota bacterium]